MHPLRNPDIQTTLLADGYVVLFSTKTDWAHTLNPLGAVVWEFCDGEHDATRIVDEVVSLAGEMDRGQLHAQVETLLSEFKESGLLVV